MEEQNQNLSTDTQDNKEQDRMAATAGADTTGTEPGKKKLDGKTWLVLIISLASCAAVILLLAVMLTFMVILPAIKRAKQPETETTVVETETESASDTATDSTTASDTDSDPTANMSNGDKFDYYMYNYVGDAIFGNLINTHFTLADATSFEAYWGERTVSLSLGEYSLSALKESYDEEMEIYAKIQELDYDVLNENQQMIYDIFSYYAELDEQYGFMPYFDEPLTCINGIHVNLPNDLAEYDFRSEEDIQDYLEMLTTVPDYFDQICTYEAEKADAGLFMSDTANQAVIDACRDVISVDAADNCMCTTFRDRISDLGLSEAEIDSYCAENEEAIETYVYAAYQDMADSMEALMGSGTNEGGMCGLENGTSYFEYLVATKVGTTDSIEDLYDRTSRQINSDLENMYEYYNEDTAAQLADYSFGSTDPEAILAELQEKMVDDFPALADVDYTILSVPEELEDISSPAFYMIPTIDAATGEENHIYVNYGLGYDLETSLYYTLAHEGYPGHLYQTNYFRQHCDDPFRNFITSQGYQEGYATYAEMNAYLWCDNIDDDLGHVLMYNHSASLGLYALMDMGINYEGWTREDTASFISQCFGVDDDELDDVTDNIYDLIVQEPGNYMVYYIGYLEILDLHIQYLNTHPTASTKDFNTALLEIGAAPFDVIREQMTEE